MSESEVTTIPKLRRVLKDTKANLDAMIGLSDGDLGYGTDTVILYRQNGNGAANWEAITSLAAQDIMSGLEADIPAVGNSREGSIYIVVDKGYICTLTIGAWVKSYSELFFAYAEATLAQFQANAGTGDFVSAPQAINDNVVGDHAQADTINQYCQVLFTPIVKVDQWRLYGHALQNANGDYKLQYLDAAGAWQDWVTGIPTRVATWSTMAIETEVITKGIRIVATTIDSSSGPASRAGELEVYHS